MRWRWIFVLVVLAPLLYASPLPSPSGTPANIILLLFDDATKSDLLQMPHVMRDIATKGATFDRFYATQSLCCPSRSTLLTGEYVHNHEIFGNSPKRDGFQKFFALGHEEQALPVQLSTHGYETGLFGKYLNGYGMYGSAAHVPPRWDRWFATFGQEYRNFLMNDQGHIRHFGKADIDYADKVFNRTGLDWIERQRSPYFAFLSILAPHTPYEKPPGYTDLYKNASPPSLKQPDFNEKDVSDKPQYIRLLPRFKASDIKGIKERYQRRLQQMRLDDDALGLLVDRLKRSHQLDNTYIFVSSDNGWMQGEHRFTFGKSVPYEEDVNLPLIVRGPGITAGRHIRDLTSMIDLYPTFLDIAGTRSDRDGRSLLPLLKGQPVTWRKQVLIENFSLDEDRVPHFFGVISDRYKYVEYQSGDKEFYDLKSDPYELRNEIQTAPDALIAEWKKRLDALSICAGDSCRDADSM